MASLLDFQRLQSEMKREMRIKECFHPVKDECILPIKQAHSLQRNGRLSLIEEDVNGQMLLYSGISFKSSKETMIADFVPVGKKVASTFYGFCSKHDTEVFSAIENHVFDGSDKHLFLHSYRSFAHSYHSKKQELQLYNSDWSALANYPEEFKSMAITGIRLALRDLDLVKVKLDQMLLAEDFSSLTYSVYETNDFYPFGCSSIVNPFVTVRDNIIDDPTNLEDNITPIILTVVPDKANSFTVVAVESDSPKGLMFIDDLDEIDDDKYSLAISSMMTKFAENFFWSPKLWNSLSETGKTVIRNDARHKFANSLARFPWSSINLFNSRFSASSLGINKN